MHTMRKRPDEQNMPDMHEILDGQKAFCMRKDRGGNRKAVPGESRRIQETVEKNREEGNMITKSDILFWLCSRGGCGQCSNNDYKKCEEYTQLSAHIDSLVEGCPSEKQRIDKGAYLEHFYTGVNTHCDEVKNWKREALK